MRKTLLMTTALVALTAATNVYAEDEHITDDITISENVTINEDNAANYATTGNISVTGGEITASGDAGLIQLSDGNKKTLSISGGELIFSNGAGIYAEGVDGQYNTTAADMNITGGNITVKDGSEITLVGKADMNIGGNANIIMDYTGETPDNEHDGGILHEGQSGNLNISGGVINLTGKVAKIERGGYDGDWIYDKSGKTVMSEEEFHEKTGKWLGENVTAEDFEKAGLNINDVDTTQYHVSTGNINITGGEINLKDGARISLTEKNTGDLNISGGKITGTEIGNYGKGNVNISGGEVTATDIGAEQGNVVISNGTVNVISGGEGLYASNTMSIKGGTVNMSGNGNRIWGDQISMTGGTLNVKDSTTFETANAVDISGGTVNIAENSSLGWSDITDNSIMNLGSQATLNLDGTLNSHVNSTGNINFQNNAAKIAGNVTMNNGGVMNVGLNHAVVDGDATFNSGSTLKIEIADTDNHGSLKANKITGNDGAKLSLNVTKQMAVGDTLTGLTLFEGTVNNKFVSELSNNRYNVSSKDGKTYDIAYTATASDVVADAGGSVNNAQTAEAWDKLVQSPTASANAKAVSAVLKDLSENNEQAYVAALTAVAPEVAPMVQQTQSENANQVFGAVGTRLTGGTVSTGGEGMSSGDSIFKRGAMWVQGLFNKSKLDDTSKAKGFDADSSGIAFGAEKFVNDDVKVGVGYAYTNTDIDGFMRSTDVDTHTAIVYGEYKPSNWYVNGIATYGWSDYEENKNVAGVGVKADYDVETFGLQAMTGYDMQVNGFGFTPEAGLRYVHIKQDAYKDSADQRVSGNDSDILTGVIGAKVSKSWELENGMNIKPEARIAATYDLMNDDVNSVVTLANGSAYSVEGKALDRFGMEFGAGVTAEVNDNVELSLGYEGKFREDYQDHTGLINAKYKF
jgi:outer membrane autotransporter barrel domain protein